MLTPYLCQLLVIAGMDEKVCIGKVHLLRLRAQLVSYSTKPIAADTVRTDGYLRSNSWYSPCARDDSTATCFRASLI